MAVILSYYNVKIFVFADFKTELTYTQSKFRID